MHMFRTALNGLSGHSGVPVRVPTWPYKLELNFFGRIIGGSWLSHERPDFIWTQNRPPFQSDFKKLGKLYRLSIK